MAAMRPTASSRRLNLLLAFGVGVLAAAVLITVAQFLTRTKAPEVVPDPVVNLSGIPQHGTVLGNPKARVTLNEYADQQCPGCRAYTLTVFPALVRDYVRPGKVAMRYHGFPFIGGDSKKALRFLLAASLQDRLWQLQEALYRHQGAENSGWVSDSLIREQASEIHGLDVSRLFTDAQSPSISRAADEQLQAAEEAGLPGTPVFAIQIGKSKPYYIDVGVSDVTRFRQALDDALNG
jgi:protein-disulfide isomerase